MGCTEPISVALAAAIAKRTLGSLPDRVFITVSGNILKNVKSVVVPNTGGLRGVTAAAAAGIVIGDPERELEVLSGATEQDFEKIKTYLTQAEFSVEETTSGCVFDIGVRVFHGEDEAYVRIEGHHTNVIRIERNGESILKEEIANEECAECDPLSVADIYEFATTADLTEIKPLLARQLTFNLKIAAFGDNAHNRARAYAAAGSDARMNGCSLPVVIVSGSGNQGMTASLPVYVYAKHLGATEEKLYRALALSDLESGGSPPTAAR